MQPIETKYHGHRFRSRLEARWAVFFDAFGLPWEYESQGYNLGELGSYLPDFIVAGRVIVEVKPPGYQASEDEWDRWNAITELPGIETFFLATGLPDGARTYHGLEQASNPLVGRYTLARCGKCWQLVFARLDACEQVYAGCRLCSLACDNQTCVLLDPYCEEITRATGARFEHGENTVVGKVQHYEFRSTRRMFRTLERELIKPAPPSIPEELKGIYAEMDEALVSMRAAVSKDKCRFFERVIAAKNLWAKTAPTNLQAEEDLYRRLLQDYRERTEAA